MVYKETIRNLLTWSLGLNIFIISKKCVVITTGVCVRNNNEYFRLGFRAHKVNDGEWFDILCKLGMRHLTSTLFCCHNIEFYMNISEFNDWHGTCVVRYCHAKCSYLNSNLVSQLMECLSGDPYLRYGCGFVPCNWLSIIF